VVKVGVTTDELAERYPRLFHLASAGSWPSIRRHGLLSTRALLDLYEVDGTAREVLLYRHRPVSVVIRQRRLGQAVIRDQKPMSDAGLRRALENGLTPAEWYGILNDKVFFWPTLRRLGVMRAAAPYAGLRHTVLVVDTKALLERHARRVVLSPLNSGCTVPMAHPRGRRTFQPLETYPFHDRLARRLDPVAEVAVEGQIPDVRDLVVSVTEVGPGGAETQLFPALGRRQTGGPDLQKRGEKSSA